ncbi:MAG: gfo/Idh/MocA family oxidoreductase, partial [Bryobacteraceae bacterium]
CVANLTASRVSTERVRKLRLFQPQEYISLDYTKQKVVRFHVGEGRQISFTELPAPTAEPLQLQFDSFLTSIETRETPKLNGMAARRTLEAALSIIAKIEAHSEVVTESLVTGWTPQ